MSEVYETIGYLVFGFLSVMWLKKIAKCSLRDYFAAQAMQALIDNDGLFSEIPTQAYEMADAMLKAREA